LEVKTGVEVSQDTFVPVEFVGAPFDAQTGLAAVGSCQQSSKAIPLYCLQGRLELWDMESMLPIGVLDQLSTSLTLEDRDVYMRYRVASKAEFVPLGFMGKERHLITWNASNSYQVWDTDPESWLERACRRAGRNLTQVEWVQYFPGEKYRKTCH
jgi:hypothetical protein